MGSGCRNPAAYEEAIGHCRRLFDLGDAYGHNMYLLDIGGGFPGHNNDELTFPKVRKFSLRTTDWLQECVVDM